MKLFEKGEWELLWPFYVEGFVPYLLHFVWIFMILYFTEIGFSLFQIGILMATIPLFALFFEIPTGAFADLYGRKASVIFGYFLEGVGFLALFFLTDFSHVVGVMAIIGFGYTFSSGAKDAWVTDLIKHKKKDFLHGYFTKLHSLKNLAIVGAGIIGAFTVKMFGLSIIWLLGSGSYLISIVALLFAEEHFIRRGRQRGSFFRNVKKQTVASVGYSKKHPVLFWFFSAMAIMSLASSLTGMISWVPFLTDLGLAEHMFGYLGSAMAATGIFAPLLVSKIYTKGQERKVLLYATILQAILLLAIFSVGGLGFAFLILLGFTFLEHGEFPAGRVYFHRFVPSKMRATIGSVETMVLAVVAIVALPLAGYLVDVIGAQYTIALSGIVMIPAAVIFYSLKDKE
jgi:DHA3 family tetracycline resistance protein-like MFS transporter